MVQFRLKDTYAENTSQLTGATERTHRKKYKQDGHGDRQDYEPASHVARPGAKCGVEPAQRENGKHCADDLVKKLPQHVPEAAEPAPRW
jgi:hypothetical protein